VCVCIIRMIYDRSRFAKSRTRIDRIGAARVPGGVVPPLLRRALTSHTIVVQRARGNRYRYRYIIIIPFFEHNRAVNNNDNYRHYTIIIATVSSVNDDDQKFVTVIIIDIQCIKYLYNIA